MCKISVIIPVYNVEKYLTKCIDSVINQTYSNLEIICIDDGSTDDSGRILDEYAKKDNRIIVIHQENKGVSAAKNRGLEVMSGDYVGFVDSDDWIETDFYENAYLSITKNDADIFCSGIYEDRNNICIKRENKPAVKDGVFGKNEALLYAFKRDYYKNFGAYLWNKVFRANLFYNIRFDEELKVAEDILVFVECVLKGQRFVYTDKAYYHYFQRNTSLIHSENLIKKESLLQSYDRIIQLTQKCGIDSEILMWIKRFRCYHASNLAEIAIEQKNYEKLDFYKAEIRRYIYEYECTNRNFPNRMDRINRILKYEI